MAQVYGDRWENVGSISEGAQAHTFLVKDKTGQLKGEYVLKRLRNTSRKDRFCQEIEALKKVDHPNVLRLIDFGTDGEKPFLVSEHCEGKTLSDALATAGGKFSLATALETLIEICKGVSALHAAGLVHRDIKPLNIYRRSDQSWVVGDLGICHLIDGDQLTLVGDVMGPRFFTAPEIERGLNEAVQKQSDVYSLGGLLYRMLAGRHCPREEYRTQEFNLANEKPRLEYVNRLLDKMLTQQPRDRYEDAKTVGEEAKRVLDLVNGGFFPISLDVAQPCRYCGEGEYKIEAGGGGQDVTNKFGLSIPANVHANWRILVCNMCGHVQYFRIEQAGRADRWMIKKDGKGIKFRVTKSHRISGIGGPGTIVEVDETTAATEWWGERVK